MSPRKDGWQSSVPTGWEDHSLQCHLRSPSPSSGKIFLYSRDVTQLPQYERTKFGLSRTYQVTNLFFNFSVLDNVVLARLGQDRSKFNMVRKLSSFRTLWEESERLLEEWGLHEKRNDPVRSLSHGEQRQLELILGLASKPRILLLDEPTAGMGKTETDVLVSRIQEFSETSWSS